MKKIIIGLFLLLSVLIVEKVNAQTYKLTINKQSGIYFARTGGSSPYMSSQFAIYKMNDEIAYCIETGKHITTYNYVDKGNTINLNYSNAVKEKLALIGYYGREYPGHDTVKYSMATQALIWEITSGQKVTFWTKQYEEGTKIDVSKEKNEITRLVNNHKKLPNIPTKINLNYQKEIEYQDELLKDFELTESNYDNIILDGDTLRIKASDIGDYKFTLTKKKYDDKDTLVFVGGNGASTQTMARLRADGDVSLTSSLHIDGVKLKINKVDEYNNPITNNNIKFKIKDVSTNEYVCENDECVYTINNDGYVLTKALPFGTYEIEETTKEIIKGYAVNQDKVKVMIDENSDSIVQVDFINYEVRGELRIHKKLEKFLNIDREFNYEYIDLEGITFDIYDDSDNYVDTITTDMDGYASTTNLKVGKYHLVEQNLKEGYWLAKEDTYFEIEQDNPYDMMIFKEIEIINFLDKGSFVLRKLDEDTKAYLPNTKVGLYNDKDELLLTRVTDQNGNAIFNDIPVDKYHIKEIEPNPKYMKTDEIIYFDIEKNADYYYRELTNKKILGTLELTKYGEKVFFDKDKVDYEKVPLQDIEFLLYDASDKLVDTLKTDSNGYVKYTGLELGKYYLVEKTKLEGYQDNDGKVFFEIKKDDNYQAVDVKLNVNNYVKKGKLEFSKTDFVTGEGIPNTIIEIYNEQDELLLTLKTDKEGKVIIDNLPLGKYYIIEKEANSLYQITNEKVYFEIKDGEITKANMVNERKVIEVPKTDLDDRAYFNIIMGFSLFLSLGGVYLERKKAY